MTVEKETIKDAGEVADIIEQAFDAGNQWGMFRVSSPFLTSPRETQEKIKEVVKLIALNMTTKGRIKMASCEKCWGDAFMKSHNNPFKDQSDCYIELLRERKDNPCTPEEQAGLDAKICPKCGRKTLHQHANICMNPECV